MSISVRPATMDEVARDVTHRDAALAQPMDRRLRRSREAHAVPGATQATHQ
jgi:hypothetical protein